jgi:hypothetical protein
MKTLRKGKMKAALLKKRLKRIDQDSEKNSFYNELNALTWEQKRLFQAYDDVFDKNFDDSKNISKKRENKKS